jgi:hypothetical protein
LSRSSFRMPSIRTFVAMLVFMLGLATCHLAPPISAQSQQPPMQAPVSYQPVGLMNHSVIFLSGIGYEYGSQAETAVLNGAFSGPEYDKYFINTEQEYPNTGTDEARDIAVESLKEKIRQIQADDPNGTITLVGSSFGSLVISKANDDMMANGDRLDNIDAFLIVNPSDGNGGYPARFTEDDTPPLTSVHGGSPTQPGGMHITSITKQYDMISDAPAFLFCLTCGLAWTNAFMGFFLVHPGVFDIDLADPRNSVRTSPDGTLTKVTVYTPQLPITQILRVIGIPDLFVDALDRVLRPLIEAAYDRTNPSMTVSLSLVQTPDKWPGAIQSIVTSALSPGSVPGSTADTSASEQPASVMSIAAVNDPQSESSNSLNDSVADRPQARQVPALEVSVPQESEMQSDPVPPVAKPEPPAPVTNDPVVTKDEPKNSEPSDGNKDKDESTKGPDMKSGNKVEPGGHKPPDNNQPSSDGGTGVNAPDSTQASSPDTANPSSSNLSSGDSPASSGKDAA